MFFLFISVPNEDLIYSGKFTSVFSLGFFDVLKYSKKKSEAVLIIILWKGISHWSNFKIESDR